MVKNGKVIGCITASGIPSARVSPRRSHQNQAAKIMADYPASSTMQELKSDPDWARESYEIGCKYGYPPGTASRRQ